MIRAGSSTMILLFLSYITVLRMTIDILPVVDAVVPHYAIDIVIAAAPPPQQDSSAATSTSSTSSIISTMLLSNAYFGAAVPMKKSLSPEELSQPYLLSYPPDDESNPLLCHNVSSISSTINHPKVIMMVPRGECTFETKAYHAQLLGASAVIVYGTLASRYSYNTTTNTTTATTNDSTGINPNMIYPKSKYDYDCNYGRALIPLQTQQLVLNPMYEPYINDPLLTTDASTGSSDTTKTNLCIQYDTAPGTTKAFSTHCASQQCLLTGNITAGTTTNSVQQQYMEACCAWDLQIYLYADTATSSTSVAPKVTIPVAYMTVQQMMKLKGILTWIEMTGLASMDTVGIVLYQRYRPLYNYSAIAIWLLGCTIATIAAYYSASEYHTATTYHYKKRLLRQQQQEQQQDEQQHSTSSANTISGTSTTPPMQQQQPAPPEEVLELTAWHALGFVIMASTSLMVLFYFKIYSVVKIMYAFGCSTAISQVIFVPLYDQFVSVRNIIVYRTNSEEFGDLTIRDIATHVCGFACGISWLIISFISYKPEEITYYWVMQDVFGACMCITFLKVIRLNSIRVASILLIVAFFYDIFFVFITPHLFHGKSVMITVATSGGPPKADALWCEKYPSDKDCQGGNPLPMLLAIPKLFDYMGGSSLLGLGDIVLPGLLLSFAARYDAAKVLLGVLGGGRLSNQSYSCPEQQCCNGILPSRCGAMLCSGGYLGPLIVAYAIGLAMANTAVYVMHMGQPALLYLVPCCLGTIVYIGYRRNELSQLWDGPRVLQTADNVLYGNSNEPSSSSSQVTSPSNNQNLHAPVPLDEQGYGDDALAAPPSAIDDDVDDDQTK